MRISIIRAWKSLSHKVSEAYLNGTVWFFLATISLVPVWFDPQTTLNSTVQDTLFVIDISESMNVRDIKNAAPDTDRLALAKSAVREAMSSLPCGSRVSMGLFAGDEVVVLFEPLEICRHFPAIEQVVSRLDSRMRWIGDSWVVRATISAIKEAEKRKLNLVFLSDWDEMPHHSAPRLTDLIPMKGKVKGLLIGVGSEAPQPVPRLDGNQQIVSYWTPEMAVIEGNHPNLLAYVKELQPGEQAPPGALDEVGEHLSAFNRVMLQASAQAAGLEHAHIQTANEALAALRLAKYQRQSAAERDAHWFFGLIAALMTIIGWFSQSIRQRLQKR